MATFDGDTLDLKPGQRLRVNGTKMTSTGLKSGGAYIVLQDHAPVPPPPDPDPDPEPDPEPEPVPAGQLPALTRAYIDARPKTGKGYDGVKSYAGSSSRPNLMDQNSPGSAAMLARGFLGDKAGVAADLAACLTTIRGTGPDGRRVLSVGRESQPIALAAILTGNDPLPAIQLILAQNDLEDRGVGDKTLRTHAKKDPTNWGCHSRASIAWFAVAGAIPKEEAADNVRRYLTTGEGFVYKDGQQTWQPIPGKLVCIGPKSDDPALDGVITNDAYRGGPPPNLVGDGANYVWEGFQGTVSAAIALDMLGYGEYVWNWGDRAILRAALWMHRKGVPASGDDLWIGHVLKKVYGADWPHALGASPVSPGKGWGFADWLYG